MFWWNDKNIEVVEIEGRCIALDGWNGEIYADCWEVEEIKPSGACFGVKSENIEIKPIYKQIDDDDFDLNGYEIIKG